MSPLADCRRKWSHEVQCKHLMLDLKLMSDEDLQKEYDRAEGIQDRYCSEYHTDYPAITWQDWYAYVKGEMSMRDNTKRSSSFLDEEPFLNLLEKYRDEEPFLNLLEKYRSEIDPTDRAFALKNIKTLIRQDIRIMVEKVEATGSL